MKIVFNLKKNFTDMFTSSPHMIFIQCINLTKKEAQKVNMFKPILQ